MIVCHCNVLTKATISEAIEDLIDEDPYQLITPGLVYRQLGKRGKCCGCFPQVVDLIVQRLEEFQTSNPCYVLEHSVAGAATASLRATGVRLALQRD
jgi:bacterioferritin-associated ferredoxin